MYLKFFNYLNKILFQYFLIVVMTFLLTILFSQSKKSIFLNLSSPNNILEIEKLINNYIKLSYDLVKNKSEIKLLVNKLSKKGSFILNSLFKRMKKF